MNNIKLSFILLALLGANNAFADSLPNAGKDFDSDAGDMVNQHTIETQTGENWYQNARQKIYDETGKWYMPIPLDYENANNPLVSTEGGSGNSDIINTINETYTNRDSQETKQGLIDMQQKYQTENKDEFAQIHNIINSGTQNDFGGDTEFANLVNQSYSNNYNRNKQKKNKDGSEKSSFQKRLESDFIFKGDERLACEAKMCLKSAIRPHECNKSLARYHSIKRITSSKTRRARKAFLDICKEA